MSNRRRDRLSRRGGFVVAVEAESAILCLGNAALKPGASRQLALGHGESCCAAFVCHELRALVGTYAAPTITATLATVARSKGRLLLPQRRPSASAVSFGSQRAGTALEAPSSGCPSDHPESVCLFFAWLAGIRDASLRAAHAAVDARLSCCRLSIGRLPAESMTDKRSMTYCYQAVHPKVSKINQN